MTMLEQIKAKIQTGETNEAMAMAMSEVMKLEIITCISDDNSQISPPYLRTTIDLFENEIDYQISEELINSNSYEQIKKIHSQRTQQGNERILKNVANLKKMFSMLNATLSDYAEN